MDTSKEIRNFVNPSKKNFFATFLNYYFIKKLYKKNRDFLFRGSTFNFIEIKSSYYLKNFLKLKILSFFCNFFLFLFQLKDEIDVVVFGSNILGSHYAEGFSDIDICFVILSKKNLKISLFFYMYLINLIVYFLNPLQHHSGFVVFRNNDWLIDGNSLSNEALDESCMITGKITKIVKWQYDQEIDLLNKKRRLNNLQKRLKAYIDNPSLKDAYRLQQLLSIALLIPCIKLQSEGNSITKKDSFKNRIILEKVPNMKSIENIRKYNFKDYKYDWFIIGWMNLINANFSRYFYLIESKLFFWIRSPKIDELNISKLFKSLLEL